MSQYPIRVAIVGDGNPGIADKNSYLLQAKGIARNLNDVRKLVGGVETPVFNAVVVSTAEEALSGHLATQTFATLIFVSNYFLSNAKELAKAHARMHLKIIVLTGSSSTEKPIILPKLIEFETLVNIIER